MRGKNLSLTLLMAPVASRCWCKMERVDISIRCVVLNRSLSHRSH
jgi:hypothetical protein